MKALAWSLAQLVVLLSLFSGAAAAQPRAAAARIQRYLDGLVKENRFSGSVLVFRGGSVVLSQGYGMASVAGRVPNSPQTKFLLGTLSHQFTVTAVLMLAEQGRLKTSDSICKYVVGCPASWQAVTVEHLLAHTSGIPDFTAAPGFAGAVAAPSPDGIVALFSQSPVQSAPGARYSFSNSNYFLLGRIVEKVSGRPFGTFLRERIFGQLGMADTGLEQPDHVARRAVGHHYGGASGFVNFIA